ncbi:hypothetical protein Scep_019290 [Stephania cephalantha]|uniref:Uncharacterized protein n=1 Tax=Stephania cephalantha TaxID=152367 RepID=A0AAP0IAE9_9MAGN
MLTISQGFAKHLTMPDLIRLHETLTLVFGRTRILRSLLSTRGPSSTWGLLSHITPIDFCNNSVTCSASPRLHTILHEHNEERWRLVTCSTTIFKPRSGRGGKITFCLIDQNDGVLVCHGRRPRIISGSSMAFHTRSF